MPALAWQVYGYSTTPQLLSPWLRQLDFDTGPKFISSTTYLSHFTRCGNERPVQCAAVYEVHLLCNCTAPAESKASKSCPAFICCRPSQTMMMRLYISWCSMCLDCTKLPPYSTTEQVHLSTSCVLNKHYQEPRNVNNMLSEFVHKWVICKLDCTVWIDVRESEDTVSKYLWVGPHTVG